MVYGEQICKHGVFYKRAGCEHWRARPRAVRLGGNAAEPKRRIRNARSSRTMDGEAGGRERPPPLPAPVPTCRRAQGPVPATPTVAHTHPGAVSQAPPPLKGQGSRTRLSGTPLKMGGIKFGRLKSVRTFGASSTLVLLAAMGARLVLSLIRHLFRSPGRCRGTSQKRRPLLNRTLRPSPHRLGQ